MFNIHFNIKPLTHNAVSKLISFFQFSLTNFQQISLLPHTHAKTSTHINVLDFMTLTLLGEENKSLSSSGVLNKMKHYTKAR